MKNINTEFFDNMSERYPKASAVFAGYLEHYKELVEWDKLFLSGGARLVARDSLPGAIWDAVPLPNTHIDAIPFEFQIGIFMSWLELLTANSGPIYGGAFLLSDGYNVEGVKQNLTRIFARIENNLLI